MNRQQLQDFINKTSQSGSVLGMESIVHLCKKLDDPQDKQQVIHIAGTNGKGSTGILLQNALIACGYKVGRYSSPAVFAYEEMFQVQGENISSQRMQDIYEKVKNACDNMVAEGLAHPTIFEVETAAAYLYFYEEKCDYSIIEVGMGGETDATNVVKNPIVSVITSISMDHIAFLGDTLEKIASMKAGIIKQNSPVVILKQTEEVEKVLLEKAKEKNAPVYIANPENVRVYEFGPDGMELSLYENERIRTQITGYVQIQNVCLARTVLEVLNRRDITTADSGKYEHCPGILDKSKMLKGIQNTTWPGRFETVLKQPRMILDGAHNADAAMKLQKTLRAFFEGKRIRFIIGVLRDKDYENMLRYVLPMGIKAYCVTPNNARGLEASTLAAVADRYIGTAVNADLQGSVDVQNRRGAMVQVCEDVKDAVSRALADSEPEDIIVAFGSLSYLAEVRTAVKDGEQV